jgi:hypothetical protein
LRGGARHALRLGAGLGGQPAHARRRRILNPSAPVDHRLRETRPGCASPRQSGGVANAALPCRRGPRADEPARRQSPRSRAPARPLPGIPRAGAGAVSAARRVRRHGRAEPARFGRSAGRLRPGRARSRAGSTPSTPSMLPAPTAICRRSGSARC